MANSEIVKDFLNLLMADRIDDAYEKYIDMNGKHHNMYFPKGFEALKEAMRENHKEIPDKRFEIRHILEDGNLVATHSYLRFEKQQMELAVVHIFRIENGKIVEMWDIGQEIPKDMPNEDGAF